MKNSEQIAKAAKFGYFATIDLGEMVIQVIMVSDRVPVMACKTAADNIMAVGLHSLEMHKITGYKYAGELAGNEEIPEGQQFRGKETGKTYTYKSMFSKELVTVSEGGASVTTVYKSEIQPIF